MVDFLEHLMAGSGNKTVTNAGHVHQIFLFVIANNQCVESMWARNVSPNDELLASIYAVLYAKREVAPLVTRITIPEDQHAWFMFEDLADLVRAQMSHFCDLDDRVVALGRHDVFLLG